MIKLIGLVTTPAIGDKPVGSTNEAGEKWIQKAIKKPGALKKQLGVAKDKPIPAGKLKAAAKKGGKLGKRARLAVTLKKLKEDAGLTDEQFNTINEMLKDDSTDHETHTAPETEPERNMSRAKLMSIKKCAENLLNMTSDEEDLEEWVHEKIGEAADHINTVFHHLDYEKNKHATAGDGEKVPADK